MTQTEHEFDELLLHDLLRELDSSALSIAEIMREEERIPYDTSEVRLVQDAFKKSAGNTEHLLPHSLSNPQEPADETARWLSEGLLFVSSLELGLGILIVKTVAGEGFFGVQRVQYCCYQTRNGFRYDPVAKTKSLTLALANLPALNLRE